jgi:hypothetical protein
MGKPFRVPKKVHKAQAPAAVTVRSSATEEELQFISFLENSSEDLSKYSRAEVAELVESTGLGLSVGGAITLWRGARKKQLQQQHSHAVQADTAVDVLLSFLRTSTPEGDDWTKAAFLAAAPAMGLTSRKLKQAFGQAKEKKQIEHRPDGTVLLLKEVYIYVSMYRADDDRAKQLD